MADVRSDPEEPRLDQAQWDQLDAIARATARDRQAVLGEAVDTYIESHRRQIARVLEGLRQARAEDFVDEEEVARAFRRGT